MLHKDCTIIGAGPIGCALAIRLIEYGFVVQMYEKRSHSSLKNTAGGRSINIALSHRAWTCLEEMGLREAVQNNSVPMYGRMIHLADNPSPVFQPYSSGKDAIWSVSRNSVNELLLDYALRKGARILFEHSLLPSTSTSGELQFETPSGVQSYPSSSLVVGTDGIHSALRQLMESKSGFKSTLLPIEYGYTELHIGPGSNLDKHALHIWPRGSDMLIALPNLDGSFTLTLFIPHGADSGTEVWSDPVKAESFFKVNFPDAFSLITDFESQWQKSRIGRLMALDCPTWYTIQEGRPCVLLGDAAHAILPFYGQGMNSGFEDVRLFIQECISSEEIHTWEAFFQNRKLDTDAIREMAYENFIEMRSDVADSAFIERKTKENTQKEVLSRYQKVSFTDIPYSIILGEKSNDHS